MFLLYLLKKSNCELNSLTADDDNGIELEDVLDDDNGIELEDPLDDVGEAVDGLTAGLGLNLNLEDTLGGTGKNVDGLLGRLGLGGLLGRKRRQVEDQIKKKIAKRGIGDLTDLDLSDIDV